MTAMDLLDDLDRRGLIHDTTDREELSGRLASGPLTLYLGIDPTGPWLHVGHLVGIVALRRFRRAGHRVVAVLGGATGMVGDPSGRSDERNLLEADVVSDNLASIRTQVERLTGPAEEGPPVQLLDNAAWTAPIGVLEFLRDVGKHVTVNQMLGRESVRSRLDSTHGISFTEFSYMLIQAHDYVVLHREHGCELQVGGSDQWGNIALGVDLTRRVTGDHVHGLTWPLLTRSDGSKFGKTAEGAVWLDAAATSPYRFFQYWMQVPDLDVGSLLRRLTLLSLDEIDEVEAAHLAAPERRAGQRRLAEEVTTLVHGPIASAAAGAATDVLFGAPFSVLPAGALAVLEDELDTTHLSEAELTGGMALVDLLVQCGVVSSKGDARRGITQGGVYLNNRRVEDPDVILGLDEFDADGALLLRRGRRSYHLVVVRWTDDVDTAVRTR